jgi:glycosyltransferase involved in cell wall biosynthesis
MRADIDAIHVHALTDALYTSWLAAKLIRRPLLFEMTLLGDDDPVSVRDSASGLAALRYALYRRCTGYVAMSGAFGEACDAAGLPRDRVRIIPQAVDTTRFSPPEPARRSAVRQELGIPADAQVVLFAGSLIRRKGLDLLMEAWRGIGAASTNRWLLLAGPAEFRDAAQQAFVDRMLGEVPPDLASRVVATGSRDDMHRIMQASDVMAFPTRREGFGTVMLEAMATGVPCVVTRLPGITDMIFGSDAESRDNGGVIVEQEDAEALARELTGLLADVDQARRIGAAGRRRAATEFDVDSVAARYVEWYGELMSRSGKRQKRR